VSLCLVLGGTHTSIHDIRGTRDRPELWSISRSRAAATCFLSSSSKRTWGTSEAGKTGILRRLG